MLASLIGCGLTNQDMKKICIFPKDAAQLIGISEREAQRLFQEMRLAYNKKKHQYITVKEFCKYTGITEEEIDFQ